MRNFIVFTLLVFVVSGFKTGDDPQAYVSPDAKLQKLHSRAELEEMGKLELTELYMERVRVITELIPYIALHTRPGATLKEMGIPATKANVKHMEDEVENKMDYLEAVDETLDDIIPYADTKNIIWSILFYERMIMEAAAGENDDKEMQQHVVETGGAVTEH